MGDLIRLLALDGPVMDVGVLVALAWLIVRQESMRSENAAAHAAITRNVEGVKQDLTKYVEGVKQGLTKDVEGVKQDVRDVKQDVRDVKQDVRMLTSHLLARKNPESDT